MWYDKIKTRIVFFSIVVCLFLSSGTHSSFSQEPLPEISDEDLELLEEFFEQAQDLLKKKIMKKPYQSMT